jgi:hypothetical protein
MVMAIMMSTSLGSADIAFPHGRSITRCVKFENIAEFPNIAVIEYFKRDFGPLYNQERGIGGTLNIVSNNSCISQGSDRRGHFYFLWAPKQWVDYVGLEKIPVLEFIDNLPAKTELDSTDSSPLHLLSTDINPLDQVVFVNPDKLRSEELSYRLYRNKSGISVYLAKKVSHYQDGTLKTETFTRNKQPKETNLN